MSTDQTEKKVFLKATVGRVWRALADSREFGEWFGVAFDSGAFAPGKIMTGVIAPTIVNAKVAAAQQPYAGKKFEFVIGDMEPEKLFSFRWHPFAIEPNVDYSAEPMTLVTFVLKEMAGGVVLTVTESGFEQIPEARRLQAVTANEVGWTMVVTLVDDYLVQRP